MFVRHSISKWLSHCDLNFPLVPPRISAGSLTIGYRCSTSTSLLESLPGLRILQINASIDHHEDVYASIAISCRRFESLELHVGTITARGYAAMFASLTKLRSLTIIMCFTKVSVSATETLSFTPLLQCTLSELVIRGDMTEL